MDRIHDILNSVNKTVSDAAQNKKSQANGETGMDEYKQSYYDMSVGSLKAIAAHAQDIINNLENEMVKNNLTAPHLQGMIAVAEDHMRSIHDFVMYVESEYEEEEEEEDEEDMEEEESKIQTVKKNKKMTKRVRIKDLPHYTFVMPEGPTQADSYNDIYTFELGPSTMKNLDDLYGDDEENTKLNDTNAKILNSLYNIDSKSTKIVNSIKDPSTKTYLTGAGLPDRIHEVSQRIDELHDSMVNVPLADNDKTLISGEAGVDNTSKPGLWENIRKKKEREGKNYRPAKPGDKDRPDPKQWKKLTK